LTIKILLVYLHNFLKQRYIYNQTNMSTHKRKAHTRVVETRKGNTNSRKTVQVKRTHVKRK